LVFLNLFIILNIKIFFFVHPDYFTQISSVFFFTLIFWKLKIVKNEAEVESYLRRAPMDLYLPVHAGGKRTVKVRNQVNDSFSRTNKAPEFETLASNMALHPQTLRRQLKREGSSFHSISAQVRRDIAIHHLGSSQLSIEKIAYLTGYTEPSAFIRAFKSWTGFTPLGFRKGLGTTEGL